MQWQAMVGQPQAKDRPKTPVSSGECHISQLATIDQRLTQNRRSAQVLQQSSSVVINSERAESPDESCQFASAQSGTGCGSGCASGWSDSTRSELFAGLHGLIIDCHSYDYLLNEYNN